MDNTVAIIPARGGSKGLVGKNIRMLCGKPLIAWTIEAALKASCISRVIVSTDCQEIAEISEKYGAEIPFLRPPELASDDSSTLSVMSHLIKELDLFATDILLLQPTSPLRTHIHINEAYKKFKIDGVGSLVSISSMDKHPYWSYKINNNKMVGFCEDIDAGTRRQDLPCAYALNGAIYIFNGTFIRDRKTLVTSDSGYYIMEKESSIDIDDILDFKIVETILESF